MKRRFPSASIAFAAICLSIAATPPLIYAAPESVSLLSTLEPGMGVETKKTDGGIAFATKSGHEGQLVSDIQLKTPLIITAVAKTDSTNLRLYFGTRGAIMFNWERKPTELRHHDPRTGIKTGVAGKGSVPRNTFVTIRWIIDDKESRVQVNGIDRAVFVGDYSGIVGRIEVGTNAGAIVTVQSLDVTATAVMHPARIPPARGGATPPTQNIEHVAKPLTAFVPDQTSIDVPVASAPHDPSPLPVSSTPIDPNAIERPAYANRPHPLLKSITSATALMVSTTPDGEHLGMASDIIATVDPDSRTSGKSGIGIIRGDGDNDMKVALEEAVRAVRLRYPIWEPGYIDLSFADKSVTHGGPSAGTVFGLLMLSTLENFDLDPKCAVTGDITVDWKVRPVGGVTAKIHGATLDKCLYCCIPDTNETSFADMALLYGNSALYDIQVFSIATLQDAEAVARKDRPANIAQAIKLFATLQPDLVKSERLTLQKPATQKTLERVLELAPNHLSAKYLLAIAQGKAPKTLSGNATIYRLSMIIAPYWRVLNSNEKLSRANLPALITADARKQLRALRPIANKEILPLLIDETAFIESMEDYAQSANDSSRDTLIARYHALEARREELINDKDVMEALMHEGY